MSLSTLLIFSASAIFATVSMFLFCFSYLKQSNASRSSTLFALCLSVLLIPLAAYALWPYLPWEQANGLEAVENFMLHHRNGEIDEAINLVSLTEQLERDELVQILNDPQRTPESWDLDRSPASAQTIVGTTTYPDGEEAKTLAFVVWDWRNAEWSLFTLDIEDKLAISQYPTFEGTRAQNFILGASMTSIMLSIFVSFRSLDPVMSKEAQTN